MANNRQIVIHYHTSGTTNPKLENVRFGEIVVRHNTDKPELIIKKNENTFATFIDELAISGKIATLKTILEGEIDSLSGAVDTKFKNYYTSAQTDTKIATAKSDAITSGAGYTDAKVEAAASTLNNTITGVDNKVTALTQTVTDNKTAVDNKFKDYYTSAQTDTKIATAKSDAITSGAGYTDAKVSGAVSTLNTAITGLDSRIDALEGLSGKTNSAIQTITISNLSGVSKTYSGTATTIDFAEMVIDCGEF